MRDPLASAKAKLRRGYQYVDQLDKEIRQRFEGAEASNRFSMRKQFYPQTQHFLWTIRRVPEVFPHWPLLVGDALSNFRAALDHLTWELVAQSGVKLTAQQEGAVQFPICVDHSNFVGQLPARAPGLGVREQALLERFQPYRGGGGVEIQALNSLVNADKHRGVPLLVLSNVTKYEMEVKGNTDCEILGFGAFDMFNRPLKLGTKLFRICVRVTGPNPDVRVQGKSTGTVCLDDGTPAPERLRKIGSILSEVIQRAEGFF